MLDGWLYPLESGHYERASQPTLFLNAGKWQYAENLERMAKLRNVAEKPVFTLKYALLTIRRCPSWPNMKVAEMLNTRTSLISLSLSIRSSDEE